MSKLATIPAQHVRPGSKAWKPVNKKAPEGAFRLFVFVPLERGCKITLKVGGHITTFEVVVGLNLPDHFGGKIMRFKGA